MPTAQEQGYERKASVAQTLKRTFKEFSEDNLTDWSAALTYYGVLSLFPALIALVSIVGLVFSAEQVTTTLTDIVTQIGPASAIETFQGPIESVTSNRSTAGIGLIAGILGALWSASGYIGAFMRASNVMYEVDEGRAIWKLRPLQMIVTVVMILLISLGAIAVVISGPLATAVGSALGVSDTAVTIWSIAKWPVLALVVATMIAVLYYASPNAKIGFRHVIPGALLAVVIWVLASLAFAFYVANFGSYDKTYGTLAGVVSFLVWLWITNIAVLLGAEFNAERERTREIAAGTPDAEREIQVPERDEPGAGKRPATA